MKILNQEIDIKNWKTIAIPLAIVLFGYFSFMVTRSSLDDSKEIIINEGQGLYVIANELKNKEIIDNKFIFVFYTIISGNERKLQAGRYIFGSGTTIPGIVYVMANGFAESDDIVVTIPEGFNIFNIDKRLTSSGLIKSGEFAAKYYKQEGDFYPDTYRFKKTGETLETIANKIEDKNQTLKEDLILASILEKEARTSEDMRLVAGVIKNRLKKGMLLQIDATVAYGACIRDYRQSTKDNRPFKYCDVSQVPVGVETKIDDPYNTYTRLGLPPGPISNPGTKAMGAALNPAETDYLFYLSTRDGNQITFSKTSTEHAANRRKYLGL